MGKAAACKAEDPGSSPGVVSTGCRRLHVRWTGMRLIVDIHLSEPTVTDLTRIYGYVRALNQSAKVETVDVARTHHLAPGDEYVSMRLDEIQG